MQAIGVVKQGKVFTVMNKVTLAILLLCGMLACKRDENNNSNVPQVLVDIFINTTQPEYQPLTVVSGWAYVNNAGSRGLVLYHNIDDEIVAYDRNCTFLPYDSCSIISMDNSNIFFRCGSYDVGSNWKPCCNSRFNLEGFPVEGPAQFVLRKYYVTQNGSLLHITSYPQ